MNNVVSFELVKLLDKIGYVFPYTINYLSEIQGTNTYFDSIPTIAEVIMWLNDVHNIWIYTTPVFQLNGGRKDHLKLTGWSYWTTQMDDNNKYVENEDLRLGNTNIVSTPEESLNNGILVILNYLLKK